MRRDSSSIKETSGSGPARSLLAAIETRLLPAIGTTEPRSGRTWEERFLMFALDDLDSLADQAQPAAGLKVTRRALKSKRISVKGPRHAANRSGIKAHWPGAAVQALQHAILIYVLDGQTDLQIGDYLVQCGPGHFLLLGPGVPHTDGTQPHLEAENLAHGSCSLLWLSPSPHTGLGCWICHSRGAEHFERPTESCYVPDHHALAMFDILVNEATAARPGRRKICALLIEALFQTVVREIEAGRIFQFAYQKADSALTSESTERKDPIIEAQEIIRDNLHRSLQIDEVARRLFLSRTEFTRRFRRETGLSFVEFLTDVRLEEAKALLANTKWSIAIIGESTGLLSSRLRVLFRQKYGISPQEYRRQQAALPENERDTSLIPKRRTD